MSVRMSHSVDNTKDHKISSEIVDEFEWFYNKLIGLYRHEPDDDFAIKVAQTALLAWAIRKGKVEDIAINK